MNDHTASNERNFKEPNFFITSTMRPMTLRTWRPRWLTLCRWYPNHQRSVLDETPMILSSSCAKRAAELLVPSLDEFERIPVSSWLLVVTLVTQIVGRLTTTRYRNGTHVSSLRCTALECFPLFWFSSGSVGRSGPAAAGPSTRSCCWCPGGLYTHMSKCLLFISTHAHRLHHVLPEKFLRNFLILKEFSFFFKLFFGYKQTGSSYLLLVTPPPYSSFLLACWCLFRQNI
jgi:hypothetical protein